MTTKLSLPELADGERYIGSIGDATGAVTHIILLPGQIKASWADANAWATSIGGELPTRVEHALMFATAKDAVDPSWYWSGEKESPESEWAWTTDFVNGGQYDTLTSNELRARAVRRLVI